MDVLSSSIESIGGSKVKLSALSQAACRCPLIIPEPRQQQQLQQQISDLCNSDANDSRSSS